MGIYTIPGQRLLLFHCSFTCIYLPGILSLLKFNESLYNVGKYKFIPILLILTFAELIKLAFSRMQEEQIPLGKIEVKSNSRSKKTLSKLFKELIKFFVVVSILFIVYYTTIVLLGAPIFAHYEETTMLSLTLVTLTFVPAFLHLGIDTALLALTRTNVQGIGLIGKAIGFNIRATIVGAWLGAIVIPLDWDRPWQAWPIPCVLGALVGYTIGHFVNLVRVLFTLRLRKKVQR